MNVKQAEREVNAVIYSNENNNVIPTDLAKAKYEYMKAKEEHDKAEQRYNAAYKNLKARGDWDEVYDFQKAIAVVEYKEKLIPILNKWFDETFNYVNIKPKKEWEFVGLYSWGINGSTAIVQQIRLFPDYLIQMFYLNHISSKLNNWELEKDSKGSPFFRLYIEDQKVIDALNTGDYEKVDKFYTEQEYKLLGEDDSGWFMYSDDFDLLFNIAVKYNLKAMYEAEGKIPTKSGRGKNKCLKFM